MGETKKKKKKNSCRILATTEENEVNV